VRLLTREAKGSEKYDFFAQITGLLEVSIYRDLIPVAVFFDLYSRILAETSFVNYSSARFRASISYFCYGNSDRKFDGCESVSESPIFPGGFSNVNLLGIRVY
jgi:hypothetical protein